MRYARRAARGANETRGLTLNSATREPPLARSVTHIQVHTHTQTHMSDARVFGEERGEILKKLH